MADVSYQEKISGMRKELRALNALVPETAQGFGQLSKAVKDNGPLGAKEKEYVALGMSVVLRCEPCINFHVEVPMKAGADVCRSRAGLLGRAGGQGGVRFPPRAENPA